VEYPAIHGIPAPDATRSGSLPESGGFW
jgi:hypothetical protein